MGKAAIRKVRHSNPTASIGNGPLIRRREPVPVTTVSVSNIRSIAGWATATA
jgi:hypothetical protein